MHCESPGLVSLPVLPVQRGAPDRQDLHPGRGLRLRLLDPLLRHHPLARLPCVLRQRRPQQQQQLHGLRATSRRRRRNRLRPVAPRPLLAALHLMHPDPDFRGPIPLRLRVQERQGQALPGGAAQGVLPLLLPALLPLPREVAADRDGLQGGHRGAQDGAQPVFLLPDLAKRGRQRTGQRVGPWPRHARGGSQVGFDSGDFFANRECSHSGGTQTKHGEIDVFLIINTRISLAFLLSIGLSFLLIFESHFCMCPLKLSQGSQERPLSYRG